MSFMVKLDRQATRPLYKQIVGQIREQIGDGRLPSGTQLPTVRRLSHSLGVTRLTVHNAYSELQADGWIEATVGRGTFVADSTHPQELLQTISAQVDYDGVLDNMQRMDQLVGLHSLAYADPDANLVSMDELWDSLAVLQRFGVGLLRYGSPQGDAFLRVQLARLLKERGVEAVPDEIIVTSGVTQGLSLATQALSRPGDTILVEQPTYLGLLHVVKSHGVTPIGIPLDEEGPELERLERIIIQQRPRFFYTIPTFHNPTGLCISAARKESLLSLAERHNLMIVEDDIYGRLAYDGPLPTSLKALDRANLVIYLDGFSKTLLPGLRVGLLLAPPPYHEQILSLRRAADLCGPALIQRALADFLEKGRLKQLLRRALPLYRERRDALLQALATQMPPGVEWTQPQGGFCCWLTLPRQAAVQDLYQAALQRGMAFTPGDLFLVDAGQGQHLRLCFGSQPVEVIEQSVSQLAALVREQLAQEQPVNRRPLQWRPIV